MSETASILRSVFSEAVEITDPVARAAFLDSACKDNAGLRARVDQLLAADASAGSFLPERPGSARPGLPRDFGAYQLLEEVARGGMGIVYRARQTQLNRLVAVKVMAGGQFAGPDFVERFRTEAEAVASLDHPNIVPIYEVGECEGQPFFSMKLVEGGTLTEAKSAISNRDAAGLVAKLSRAIHYAHQRGILHRDIKPGNVLLDADGEPHLTDFGLAKLVEKDSTLTRTMAMLGTPSYMSPEQARGEAKQLTTAVDVYGLGAIFYELLAGQPPFAGGTTMETVRQVLEKEPRPPSAIKPGTDSDLETICLKCLAKEPSGRYSSAEALAADLERWLRHEPIIARPVSGWERVAKWMRRHPLATILCTITLLAITASVGTLIRANIHIRTAQGNEANMRRIAEGQERIARGRAYASDINLAQQALAENNLGRARELLGRQRPGSATEVDLRGWEWRYLWQQCRSDALFRLARDQGSVYALAASPDARWLAVGGQSGANLDLWDLTTRRVAKRLADGVTSTQVAFSPTDPLLAYATTRVSRDNAPAYRLRLWNTATQAKASEWPLPGSCAGLAFSPDGQTLLTAIREPDAQFVLWNVRDGTVQSKLPTVRMHSTVGTPFAASRDLSRVATSLEGYGLRVTDLKLGTVAWENKIDVSINSLAIDPAGTTLAAGIRRSDPFIQLYNLATGQEIGRLPVRNGYVISMQFAPDGRTLLAGGSDQTITHWDLDSRQPLTTLRGHTLEVWRLALLADGRTVVSGSGDGDVMFWDLRNAATHDFRATLPVVVRACWRFAPTSDAILTCELDGSVTRWTGRDFKDVKLLLNVGTKPVSVVLSEDCGTVAATFPDGNVRVWDLQNGSLRREFNAGSDALVVWGFASNSNHLLLVNKRDQSLHEWDLVAGIERTLSSDLVDWRVHGAFPAGVHQRSTSKAVIQQFDALPKVQRPLDRVTRSFAGAFSPDDRYFARSLPMSVVEIDSAETGQSLGQVRGFLQGVHSLAFSPDSRRLAAGSDDRQAVKLWDTQSFQELVTLRGEGTSFSETHFSPDGNLLGTMNSIGVLHVWRAPSWAEIEAEERHPADQ